MEIELDAFPHSKQNEPDDEPEEEIPEIHYCNKCHRCLTYNDGITVAGLSIRIVGLDSDSIGRRVKKQLGDLAPRGDVATFIFCYKCYLNAFFR